jgi:hypothetical protein
MLCSSVRVVALLILFVWCAILYRMWKSLHSVRSNTTTFVSITPPITTTTLFHTLSSSDYASSGVLQLADKFLLKDLENIAELFTERDKRNNLSTKNNSHRRHDQQQQQQQQLERLRRKGSIAQQQQKKQQQRLQKKEMDRLRDAGCIYKFDHVELRFFPTDTPSTDMPTTDSTGIVRRKCVLLRTAQRAIIELLFKLDELFQRHKIRYWIDSGTLLGAVRDGHMIPWDADADIGMSSAALQRLRRTDLRSELDPQRYLFEMGVCVCVCVVNSSYCIYFVKISFVERPTARFIMLQNATPSFLHGSSIDDSDSTLTSSNLFRSNSTTEHSSCQVRTQLSQFHLVLVRFFLKKMCQYLGRAGGCVFLA